MLKTFQRKGAKDAKKSIRAVILNEVKDLLFPAGLSKADSSGMHPQNDMNMVCFSFASLR